MAREPDEPNEWCVLDTYADRFAAEVDAGVEVISDFPGQVRGAQLLVDAALAHRARWLLKLSTVSDAELEYLATGKLPNPTDDTQ